MKHLLHSVANEIAEEAVEHDCDGIIFEKLDGIRDRLPYADWHSLWAFRKLKQFVEHKPEEHSVFVDMMNPQNTSKRCNECGCVHDGQPSPRRVRVTVPAPAMWKAEPR
ncbi:zinc ribbon domain-containing protein [Haloquadratum walsbyi]|uniref:IS200/IS605 family accessory protein TnpB-related protein n=1 Tax=Haloquadratum walsbyi TaxID=293091 RepID=UPI00064FE3B3|nr:zinc ribbon domain-containing protein [Haloquadratum walsbyi]